MRPRWLCSLFHHRGATLMYDEDGYMVKDCSCRTIIFASFDPDHTWDQVDYKQVIARYGLEDIE